MNRSASLPSGEGSMGLEGFFGEGLSDIIGDPGVFGRNRGVGAREGVEELAPPTGCEY